jgi:hypothetical protein
MPVACLLSIVSEPAWNKAINDFSKQGQQSYPQKMWKASLNGGGQGKRA